MEELYRGVEDLVGWEEERKVRGEDEKKNTKWRSKKRIDRDDVEKDKK